MKKILALVLAAVMLSSMLLIGGCGKKDDDDKGAIIQMFLSSMPATLDPTAAQHGSADNAKLFGLLYEGLYTINEKGELKKALADEVEYYVDARDNYLKLEISLNDSRWSDGIVVDGAIMRMATSDRGRINKDFGYLQMIPLNYTDEDLKREPHLKVWKENIPDARSTWDPTTQRRSSPYIT